MVFNNTKVELTDELLVEIVKVAREVYGDRIYVPCEKHLCGWDFITFDGIEEYEEILEYKFEICDISDNIYSDHDFEDKTLKEILTITKNQFNFE